ncbi:MAG: hypothetical protein JWN86_4321 [Planctomycetota bacterium]|nr:hypothetical protein [Planctomycetota bacterium]
MLTRPCAGGAPIATEAGTSELSGSPSFWRRSIRAGAVPVVAAWSSSAFGGRSMGGDWTTTSSCVTVKLPSESEVKIEIMREPPGPAILANIAE